MDERRWVVVDLREVEIFLTLTEELHFGRTAERLGLSQSRISRAVQALERRIGSALFERTSRSVRLTALGLQLRDELGPAYAGVEAALTRARRRAEHPAGRLRVGLWSLPSGGDFLLGIVRLFRRRHPGWEVELVASGTLRQLEALRAGTVDLLVLWLPVTEPDLIIGPVLSTQQRIVRLGVDHPLATRDVLTLDDLADYEVAAFYGVPESSAYALAPAHTPDGRPIRRGREVRDQTELTQQIVLGEVLHPAVTSAGRFTTHPGITERPLHGLPPARSALVWHAANRAPGLQDFAAVAGEVLSAG